jgi:anti-sigma-K factor RskA
MVHEEYKDLLTIEAINALDVRERQELKNHLATCDECRNELRALQASFAALTYTSVPVAPSPELRSRVLEQIKGTQSAKHTTPNTNVVQFPERNKSAVKSYQPFIYATVAASIVIALFSLPLFTLWKRNNEMKLELVRVNEQMRQMKEEIARTQEMREVITNPESNLMVLTGTEMAPKAGAKLIYDRRTGRTILFAHNLPPAPEGKAYQLWFIVEGKPLPGGVFTTDHAGQAMLRDQMPKGGSNVSIFAVTLEPAQGMQSPTGNKYLLGST